MKKAYRTISLVFALIGIIIAFENIQTTSQVLILFTWLNQSLFFSFMIMMVIGMASGLFLGLSHGSKNKNEPDLDNIDF